MNRRRFLKSGSIARIAATSLVAVSCQSPSAVKNEDSPSDAVPFTDEFELNETTIDMLLAKMESGAYTSRSITALYLGRIEAIDKKGPALNAVIELNPDALAIADQMDNERKAGKVRGPLHGIPVLIKDNIDTADKMMTTAGSLALEGHKATKDAFVIK